jgi:predicted outer membrane protein
MTVSPGRRAAGLAVVLALTTGTAAACGSAQAAGTNPASPYNLSSRDIHWLDMAHQVNLAEIQTGQYAETNTGTAAVKSAGAAMVHDHTALDITLVGLANRLHVGLPQYLTNQQVETGDRLSSELGLAFDDDFIGSMLTGHHQMIAATEAEISQGSSPPVVGLARQALPVLEKHLMMLRAAASSG